MLRKSLYIFSSETLFKRKLNEAKEDKGKNRRTYRGQGVVTEMPVEESEDRRPHLQRAEKPDLRLNFGLKRQ